jgi:hypothetical protein
MGRVNHPVKPQSKDINNLVDSIRPIAKEMQNLAHRAVWGYSPEVEAIITERCRDVNRIEHLLDHMLDFCFDQKMLMLFKKLSRYLYTFDPAAAADYERFYRDMWDDRNALLSPNKNR